MPLTALAAVLLAALTHATWNPTTDELGRQLRALELVVITILLPGSIAMAA